MLVVQLQDRLHVLNAILRELGRILVFKGDRRQKLVYLRKLLIGACADTIVLIV